VSKHEAARDAFGYAVALSSGSDDQALFQSGPETSRAGAPAGPYTLALVFAEIMDSDDVRVIAETPHACASRLMRCGRLHPTFRFNLCESDIAIEHGIMDEVDPFFAPLASSFLT